MKLVRFGERGAERPGILDARGRLRDLSGHLPDITGETLTPDSLDRLRAIDPGSLPSVEGSPRLGPPVGAVSKFVCVGLNYSDHAAETGAAVPPEPILFMKAPTAANGPNDPITIPRDSHKLDYEIELAVVIGRRAKYVDEADAFDHVAGYCAFNDVSERAFQMERHGTFMKGKSHDTFAPFGPWLVTRDEVADPQNLSLWLEVDGEPRQKGSTGTMIFGVSFLISYISQFMTLLPGDVIATGTPPGVGLGRRPPVFLTPGQTIRAGVEGLGVQQQQVVACPD